MNILLYILFNVFIINVYGKTKNNVIYEGIGDASFYYDINKNDLCTKIMKIKNYSELNGNTMCDTYNMTMKPPTLRNRNTNYIVAIPNNMLLNNRKKYCGKEIIVKTKNTQLTTKHKLIIWDGCKKCNDNGGLDFSGSVFVELFGNKSCSKGRLHNIKWEIVNNQLLEFNP